MWRSFRYLRLRLKYCAGPFRIKTLRAAELNYPYEERGGFQGNERLERVFDICRTTIKLCSIEALMDTPFPTLQGQLREGAKLKQMGRSVMTPPPIAALDRIINF